MKYIFTYCLSCIPVISIDYDLKKASKVWRDVVQLSARVEFFCFNTNAVKITHLYEQ